MNKDDLSERYKQSQVVDAGYSAGNFLSILFYYFVGSIVVLPFVAGSLLLFVSQSYLGAVVLLILAIAAVVGLVALKRSTDKVVDLVGEEAQVSDVKPAPGWYYDGSGHQRYWDGQRWTEHVHPAEQHPH